MQKIIVTGATSMIGVATIEEALANDVEVYAIVRHKTKRRKRLPTSRHLHIVERDLDALKTAADEIPGSCDVFYHFAWSDTAKAVRDDPKLQLENVNSTLNAVDLAHQCGCKKFIGAGSQAEYGSVAGIIDAATPFDPQLAYGVAKYAAGLLSKKLCDSYGMVHIWGRIFSVYGRYDNEGTMLDYAIRQFQNKEPAHFSAGTQPWDYLYEKDAGKIFYLLGEKVHTSHSYRIASGTSRPLRDYILCLANQMDASHLCEFAKQTSVRAVPPPRPSGRN